MNCRDFCLSPGNRKRSYADVCMKNMTNIDNGLFGKSSTVLLSDDSFISLTFLVIFVASLQLIKWIAEGGGVSTKVVTVSYTVALNSRS